MTVETNELSGLLSSGNSKLPTTTAIFNMTTALDCPSMKLGLCKACVAKVKCYARKAEQLYPTVLPYRKRQQIYWENVSSVDFVKHFLVINARKTKKYTLVRLNEAGDFSTQSCVEKAEEIATALKEHGVVVYCYTSRDDLNYEKVKNLVINGSGFIKEGISNIFQIVHDVNKKDVGYGVCAGDCRICIRCSKRGMKTVVKNH